MSTDVTYSNCRFAERLNQDGIRLERGQPTVLQLNVGRLCNQTCRHCHVNAGPTRTELMTMEVAEEAVAALDRFPAITTLDITGGAPEMAPPFRWLVEQGSARGLRVIDRCNLTILQEPGYADLADFLTRNRVEIVASLPCYTAGNVDKQRGDGVFMRSIEALRILNERGYGIFEGADRTDALRLNLVYNPGGPALPPPQQQLQADYRKRLREDFGIVFDNLITIANMPIGRFRSDLQRMGKLETYLEKLVDAFNPKTIPGLMCATHLSVDYEGYLYDCDFNQMEDLPMGYERLHIRDLTPERLAGLRIATADHCFGCTAGQGSSCGGALS